MIQSIVIEHMTPYRTGDMVINCKISLAWSEGGFFPEIRMSEYVSYHDTVSQVIALILTYTDMDLVDEFHTLDKGKTYLPHISLLFL